MDKEASDDRHKQITILENKIQSLKTNLENSMITLDEKKFKTDLFSFGIQR